MGGSVGRLDNVVNYVISAIGVGAAASVALLGAGFAGRCFGRRQLHLAIALAFAVGILALGLLGAGIALGPGPQAASYCSALSGNTTSCASFLGSVQAGIIPGACTECSTRFTWGGGYGWYATLGGAAASLFAGYLLWRGRAGPFTPEEQAEWAARNRPYSLTGRTLSHAKGIRGTPPPPTGRSAIPFASGRTSRWVCRHCGTVNSPWATHCGGCRESRSHPGR